MPRPDHQPEIVVEVCVRSLAPATDREHQERVVDRLEAFADDRLIGSFDLTVWGDEIPLDRPPRSDTGRRLYRTLGRFERWDEHTARNIRPFFQTRTRECELTEGGTECEVMTLPELALAEYRDGHLVWVSPHRRGEAVHTVDDHLEALASKGAKADDARTTVEPLRGGDDREGVLTIPPRPTSRGRRNGDAPGR